MILGICLLVFGIIIFIKWFNQPYYKSDILLLIAFLLIFAGIATFGFYHKLNNPQYYSNETNVKCELINN